MSIYRIEMVLCHISNIYDQEIALPCMLDSRSRSTATCRLLRTLKAYHLCIFRRQEEMSADNVWNVTSIRFLLARS